MRRIFVIPIFTILYFASTTSLLAQFDSPPAAIKYRRSSLHTMLVETADFPSRDKVISAFKKAPFPDKYNDHRVDEAAFDAKSIAPRDAQGNIDLSNVPTLIERHFIDAKLANQLVAKWFNRQEDGSFDMSLIAERGSYAASDMDLSIARGSARGLSTLSDAGEELIANTFVVVSNLDFFSNEPIAALLRDSLLRYAQTLPDKPKPDPNAKVTVESFVVSNIANKEDATKAAHRIYESTKDAWTVVTQAYLYRLLWNDSIANIFYTDLWMDKTNLDAEKKEAFDNSDLFKLTFVGSSYAKSNILFNTGRTADENIQLVTVRNFDKVIDRLQRSYDEFKTKTPLYSGDPITAKIGLKEGLDKGDKFEVLEQVIDKNGKTKYVDKGTITVKSRRLIWDNRYTLSDSIETNQKVNVTTFNGGKKYYTGMLIRQKGGGGNRKPINWARAGMGIMSSAAPSSGGNSSAPSATPAAAAPTSVATETSFGQSTLISQGKHSTQSSISQWDKDDNGAVDGVINGSYGFHTNNEQNPWWQVDLGSPMNVTKIKIFNREDCCSERARTIRVLFSEDGRSFQTMYQHNGAIFGGARSQAPLDLNFNSNVARFIRLELTENNSFHLDEVQVYGSPVSNNTQPSASNNSQPPIAAPAEPVADQASAVNSSDLINSAIMGQTRTDKNAVIKIEGDAANESPDASYSWKPTGTIINGAAVQRSLPEPGYVVLKDGTKHEGEMIVRIVGNNLTTIYITNETEKGKFKDKEIERYGLLQPTDPAEMASSTSTDGSNSSAPVNESPEDSYDWGNIGPIKFSKPAPGYAILTDGTRLEGSIKVFMQDDQVAGVTVETGDGKQRLTAKDFSRFGLSLPTSQADTPSAIAASSNEEVGNSIQGVSKSSYITPVKEEISVSSNNDHLTEPPFNPSTLYRLTTQWQGEGKSMEMQSMGGNNYVPVRLGVSGNTSAQAWKIISMGNGYYRLSAADTDQSIDLVDDRGVNVPQVVKSYNASGQYWKITPLGNGFFRLTSMLTGDGLSLDVRNDGTNNILQLTKTGGYSGQFWKIQVFN